MNIKKYLFTAFLVIITCSATVAQNAEVVMAKVKQVNNAINSIESPFSQKKTMKMINRSVESEGSLYYDKDYYLDMSYTKPAGHIILIDGAKFIVKKGSAVNRFNTDKNADMRLLRNALINSFAGNVEEIAKENGVKPEYTQKDGCHVFSIVNNNEKKRMYNGFIIFYDSQSYRMKKITILESNGNYTDYILKGNQILDKPFSGVKPDLK